MYHWVLLGFFISMKGDIKNKEAKLEVVIHEKDELLEKEEAILPFTISHFSTVPYE